MTDDFTPEGYAALLDGFSEQGYETSDYANAEVDRRHLILRHDLDMSIQAALPIAELEAQRGMRATYFVLLRTEMYNPFSSAGLRDLHRILDLDHQIGLHLDASHYPDEIQALDEAATRECVALEALLQVQVSAVSFHRPAKSLLNLDRPIAGRLHAYQPRFFSDMGYCSDSRGAWHSGHPLKHDAVPAGCALQVLTHPVWWSDGRSREPFEILEQFRHERYELLRRELAANCRPYAEALEED